MALRDCYPCFGRGFVRGDSTQFVSRCGNCGGTGISPNWRLSDGSDPSKRPTSTPEATTHDQ